MVHFLIFKQKIRRNPGKNCGKEDGESVAYHIVTAASFTSNIRDALFILVSIVKILYRYGNKKISCQLFLIFDGETPRI
jgi:hypothetical protein